MDDFPGANGDASLPQAPDPVHDPNHNHEAWLRRNNQGGAVKLQYGAADIPAYWAFAQQFTLCDAYHTEIASQSEPNHLVLIAASSPLIDNFHAAHPGQHGQPSPPFHMPNLPATLATHGLDWRNYSDPNEAYFDSIAGLAGDPSNVSSAQFDVDVARGYLPAVVVALRTWRIQRASAIHYPRWAATGSGGKTGNAMDCRPRGEGRCKSTLGKYRNLYHLG